MNTNPGWARNYINWELFDFEETLNILSKGKIGDLNWIEFRELSSGAGAFKEIHNGSCESPKIILLINS